MIIIVSYQAKWPEEFRALGSSLREVLGEQALRIDHIGSTSVPGLAAKDLIDIQVTVASLDQAIAQAICEGGYQRVVRIDRDHVPPGAPEGREEWTKWLFKAPAGQRPVNLHVRIAGRANQRYPLLFRDYLRSHGVAAEAYARAKMALARYHPDDIDAYCDIKDPVCDIIVAGAEAWAAASHWQPGASDA